MQPSGNTADQYPESSPQMKSVGEGFALVDGAQSAGAEEVTPPIDSLINNIDPLIAEMPDSDDMSLTDSLTMLSDSLLFMDNEELALLDSVPRKRGALEAPVEFASNDSIIFTADNMAYLYGSGNIKYQSIELSADYIQMDMDSSQLFARYSIDSLGNEFGHPVFTQEQEKIESKEMHYNFKSGKALAKESKSQQGEGYILAGTAKKMDNGIINMTNGKYSTCDNHDHPHFYLNISKGKVWSGKSVVTGPCVLYIEDVPLPIVLPFAFFPFTDTYSSGIIMPTYGDEMNRGFYLRNGGYYFALGDHVDLSMTGELYTKGSWGLSGQSAYRKRYK